MGWEEGEGWREGEREGEGGGVGRGMVVRRFVGVGVRIARGRMGGLERIWHDG